MTTDNRRGIFRETQSINLRVPGLHAPSVPKRLHQRRPASFDGGEECVRQLFVHGIDRQRPHLLVRPTFAFFHGYGHGNGMQVRAEGVHVDLTHTVARGPEVEPCRLIGEDATLGLVRKIPAEAQPVRDYLLRNVSDNSIDRRAAYVGAGLGGTSNDDRAEKERNDDSRAADRPSYARPWAKRIVHERTARAIRGRFTRNAQDSGFRAGFTSKPQQPSAPGPN